MIAAALLLQVSCAGKVDRGLDLQPKHQGQIVASIERTSCYGWCPVYRLTVFADGFVEYIGVDFVLHKGYREGQVTQRQLADLQAVFADHEFEKFGERYEAVDYTDFPTVIMSYRLPQGLKRVVHYYGDTSAPAELTTLEDRVEQILAVENYIGTREQREIFAEAW